MRVRRKGFIFCLALAALAVGICFSWRISRDGLPSAIQTGDGMRFRVVGVSFGRTNEYRERTPKDWQLAIGNRLPFSIAAALGWRFKTADYAMSTTPEGLTILAIHATREGRTPTNLADIHPIILDDEGHWSERPDSTQNASGVDLKKEYSHRLVTWNFLSFPRRSKNLTIRFVEGRGTNQAPALEFKMANPAWTNFPSWNPEPWPATRTNGDLTATLLDFQAGKSATDPADAAIEGESAQSIVTIKFTDFAHTNFPWNRYFVSITDATGNASPTVGVVPARDPKIAETHIESNSMTMTVSLPGNLRFGEAASKVTAMLTPAGGPFENTVTFPPFAVPTWETKGTVTLSTNIAGKPFTAKSVLQVGPEPSPGGPTRPKPSVLGANAESGSDGKTTPLHFALETGEFPKDELLYFVKALDASGEKIRSIPPKDLTYSDEFKIAVPTNTPVIQCVFGIRKLRSFEFLAAPKLP